MTETENEDFNFGPYDFRLTDNGLVSLLAVSLYDAYLYPMRFDEPSRSILPVVLEPKWIGREFLGPTLSFIKE